MPKYIFDFNMDAWVQGVEIEADTLEQAKEKFYKMSAGELIDNGYVQDFNITDVDIDKEDED